MFLPQTPSLSLIVCSMQASTVDDWTCSVLSYCCS